MENTYLKRRQSLQQGLAQLGVEYAIINNPINVLYLTGVFYHTRERFMALRMNTANGETRLVLPAMEQGRLQDPTIEQAPFLDGEDHIGLLCAGLKQGACLGIEKDYLNFGRTEAIVERSGNAFTTLVDIAPAIALQRLRKDEAEIALLQKACAMTDATLDEWKNNIRTGITESELRFELLRLVNQQEGAEFSFDAQISSGSNTSVAHGVREERALQENEPVLIDFGIAYDHYHADITRVFFIGEPSAQWREIYETVLAANLAGIAAAKPGVPIKEVDLAARRVIEAAGYGANFTHRTGHGLGLEVHEDPYARGDNEELLQEGMVFTVEPGIYLPGLGGIRIEDDVLITAQGAKVLTAYPKNLEQIIIK